MAAGSVSRKNNDRVGTAILTRSTLRERVDNHFYDTPPGDLTQHTHWGGSVESDSDKKRKTVH